MGDREKKKVTFGDWEDKRPKTKVVQEQLPKTSRRSTGQISDNSKLLDAAKTERISLPLSKNRRAPRIQTTKSLIRNCSSEPVEVARITKPHETKQTIVPTKTMQTHVKGNPQPVAYSIPSKHTTLQTARQIRKISELDLENAYKCVESLKLSDENLNKKVSSKNV